MTTGATLSGQLIFGKKAGRWVQGHLGPVELVMFLCCQAWISLLLLPEAKAKKKTNASEMPP